jgi:hypothetical protein
MLNCFPLPALPHTEMPLQRTRLHPGEDAQVPKTVGFHMSLHSPPPHLYETGSCYIAQVGLELKIILFQSRVLGLQLYATIFSWSSYFWILILPSTYAVWGGAIGTVSLFRMYVTKYNMAEDSVWHYTAIAKAESGLHLFWQLKFCDLSGDKL